MQDNIITNKLTVFSSLNLGSDFPTVDANGAVPTSGTVALDASAAALALTLADGSEGDVVSFFATSSANNAVVTPANLLGQTDVTFAAAGDSATLQFLGGSWIATSAVGAVVA
jgi:hypothetical protein